MTTPARVLMIDDDAAVRRSLKAFFEDAEFEVSEAESVSKGLAMLSAGGFDVGVVDMRLPDGDGESLILRAAALGIRTRFLIYTGSTLFQITAALGDTGMSADDVFYKPASNLTVLVDAARRLMTQRGASHG